MTAALCLYLAIGRRSVHLLQKQSSAILSMTDFDPLELQRVLESEMSRHSDEEMYQTYLELDGQNPQGLQAKMAVERETKSVHSRCARR
jgi:hypothetical protein